MCWPFHTHLDSAFDNNEFQMNGLPRLLSFLPIWHVFNRCLACSLFPLQWKESKIIPITFWLINWNVMDFHQLLCSEWKVIYLKGGKKVYYNCYFSDGCDVNCGLVQGSCHGPLLYSVFTNNLPFISGKSLLVMYADDSTMFYSANSEKTSVLQQDLLSMFEWISKNNMILNVSKSKS